jgi:hypothetical protein
MCGAWCLVCGGEVYSSVREGVDAGSDQEAAGELTGTLTVPDAPNKRLCLGTIGAAVARNGSLRWEWWC